MPYFKATHEIIQAGDKVRFIINRDYKGRVIKNKDGKLAVEYKTKDNFKNIDSQIDGWEVKKKTAKQLTFGTPVIHYGKYNIGKVDIDASGKKCVQYECLTFDGKNTITGWDYNLEYWIQLSKKENNDTENKEIIDLSKTKSVSMPCPRCGEDITRNIKVAPAVNDPEHDNYKYTLELLPEKGLPGERAHKCDIKKGTNNNPPEPKEVGTEIQVAGWYTFNNYMKYTEPHLNKNNWIDEYGKAISYEELSKTGKITILGK